MKNIDRKKLLSETESQLKYLKSHIGKKDYDQELLKIHIESTKSIINSIKNNETLIG
jgi:hypothetical protein